MEQQCFDFKDAESADPQVELRRARRRLAEQERNILALEQSVKVLADLLAVEWVP